METITEEKRRYGSVADWNAKSNNYWDKRFVFVMNHRNSNPSVEGMNYPHSFSIPLEDKIFDEKSKKVRTIRVVNGEVSIWKDQQTEDGQKLPCVRKQFSKKGDIVIEAKEEQTL